VRLRLAFLMLAPAFLVAAAPNWVGSVRTQPNGAVVMGNPAAKVKLVEYLSYTCGHCAHFAGESKGPLRQGYVAKGLVSVELRNAVRDRFDFAAAVLARCGGPSRFHGNSEALFAAQESWLGRAQAFEAENSARMNSLSINDSLKLIARGIGLDAIMKERGFTPAQIDVCLTSKPDQDAVVGMANEAWNTRKIKGTPSFMINGAVVEGVGNWVALEPRIKSAAMAVR
jgi:protein-disulfide isomerase